MKSSELSSTLKAPEHYFTLLIIASVVLCISISATLALTALSIDLSQSPLDFKTASTQLKLLEELTDCAPIRFPHVRYRLVGIYDY
jgi:2-keto-3-deoxy-L-rhamnonate aldolase RhmA